MPIPPLPSAVFLSLVPDRDNPLTLERLGEIAACLESGHWTLDPGETDPRNGLSLVHAIADQYTQDDEVRKGALSLAVKFGVDVNATDPDGKTAWERAWAREDRTTQKHLESLGAHVPSSKLAAAQEEVIDTLHNLPRSFAAGARLVERTIQEKIFGSLDDEPNGVPLGLHMLWGYMGVNGAHIARGDSPAETNTITDHVMGRLSSMGKKALELEPSSRFPIWCWLAQSQAVYWSGPDASDSRRRKWEGNWRSLEKKLLKVRYPGKDRAQAEACLARELTQMVSQAMRKAAGASDMDRSMLQPLSATVLTGLLSWKNRMDGMRLQDLAPRRQAAWDAAAHLPREVPEDRWSSGFSSAWASPLAYALKTRDVLNLFEETGPLPEWMPSPWLTLLPLLETQYRFNENPGERARLAEWMGAIPAPADEVELGLQMISHCPQLQTALREQLMAKALPEAGSKPRFRF